MVGRLPDTALQVLAWKRRRGRIDSHESQLRVLLALFVRNPRKRKDLEQRNLQWQYKWKNQVAMAHRTIALRAGLDIATVNRALRDLVEVGLLTYGQKPRWGHHKLTYVFDPDCLGRLYSLHLFSILDARPDQWCFDLMKYGIAESRQLGFTALRYWDFLQAQQINLKRAPLSSKEAFELLGLPHSTGHKLRKKLADHGLLNPHTGEALPKSYREDPEYSRLLDRLKKVPGRQSIRAARYRQDREVYHIKREEKRIGVPESSEYLESVNLLREGIWEIFLEGSGGETSLNGWFFSFPEWCNSASRPTISIELIVEGPRGDRMYQWQNLEIESAAATLTNDDEFQFSLQFPLEGRPLDSLFSVPRRIEPLIRAFNQQPLSSSFPELRRRVDAALENAVLVKLNVSFYSVVPGRRYSKTFHCPFVPFENLPAIYNLWRPLQGFLFG